MFDLSGQKAPVVDVGACAAFLASREAFNVTCVVHHIDGASHIVG